MSFTKIKSTESTVNAGHSNLFILEVVKACVAYINKEQSSAMYNDYLVTCI